MRILILHQDMELVHDLEYSFKKDGEEIEICDSISKAVKKMKAKEFSFCIVGGNLPDGTALDFKRELSDGFDVPSIVLDSNTEQKKIVLCLEYGFDDYMRYPIDLLELKSRMRAILRRYSKGDENIVIDNQYLLQSGVLQLDLSKQILEYNEKNLQLGGKEFQLMAYFISNPNRLLSREELADSIWGNIAPNNIRTVDVNIRRLRKRLKAIEADDLIQTRWKEGYIYKSDNKNQLK